MSVASPAVEDYVKTVYSLTQSGAAAATSDLAERLGLTPGSVSAMVKRLGGAGLLEHEPYHGVRLTAEGERLALTVIRRHRLIETFLATTLDIPWEDVHRHAETLEHAASDELIEIIARKLGDPVTDPHGDPIPTRELEIDDRETRRLADLAPGEHGWLVRVSDSNPEMLRFISDRGIAIGDELEMVGHEPFGGPCEVRIGGHSHLLGLPLARAMRVR